MVSKAELKQELIDAGIRPSVQRLAIFEYVKRVVSTLLQRLCMMRSVMNSVRSH